MAAYRQVLAQPSARGLFLSTVLIRLPMGVNSLAMLLYVHDETGSFAWAGAAAGGLAAGVAVGGPVVGRLVDVRGTSLLLRLAVAHAAAVGSVLAAGALDAPSWVFAVLALAVGVLFPPTASVLRAEIPWLMGERRDLVIPAFALDSALLQVGFVGAPLLVAAVVSIGGSAPALGISAASLVAGTMWFLSALPDDFPLERGRSASRWGALSSPAIRTLIASTGPVGFAAGAINVAVAAFGHDHGGDGLASLLIAMFAFGSIGGALLYGLLPRVSLAEVHLRLALAVPIGFVPILAADGPWLMVVLLVPAGLALAPLSATRNELAGLFAPAGTKTEALTWPLTALFVGVSAGSALAGVAVDEAGWRAGVLVGITAAVVGAVIASVRQSTLTRPPADTSISPAVARASPVRR